MQNRLVGYFVILLTILIAMVLNSIPVPQWAIWFRPEWVGLVMVYWLMMTPERVGLAWAWIIGLLIDVLYGSVLGEHALALVAVAYVVQRFYLQIRLYPTWQQAAYVMAVILLYQSLIYLIQGMLHQVQSVWLFWIPAITSMILWPWVALVLSDVRKRLRI